jgi:AcrR family transcriptional regulator
MSPRPKKISKTQSNVTEARQKILASARDLFVERGFHHTSVDDIAGAAGLSRATCYYQFKSKSGILDAVIAAIQDRAPVKLRSRIANPTPSSVPAENLRGLIADICLIWEEDRLLFRKVMTLGEVDPELRGVIDERQADRSAAVGRALSKTHSSPFKTRCGRGVVGFDKLSDFRLHEVSRLLPTSRRDAH